MLKYIKKFETLSQYNAYTEDTVHFVKPNVSIITETNGVAYHPFDPYNGHEYVEIGGLKWATMNIGATEITDYGLYFQWGDTQGYTASQVGTDKIFNWANYKYCDGTKENMTKYNDTDGKTVLDAEDDAAQANWGGLWRMPTKDDFQALGDAIDFINPDGTSNNMNNDKRTTLNGVTGILVADKNDHSKRLFFPAAGSCDNSTIYSVGSSGAYLSSSFHSGYEMYQYEVYQLIFHSINTNWAGFDERCFGSSVRPVIG